ncbi:hypothetical protein ACI093_001579 [Cronobacter turicensis]
MGVKLKMAKVLHSVTDKSLYDALCQPRVTTSELRELFLERGIIISKKTDKKELAKNFSKLTHDYYVQKRISDIFGGFLHKEKTTSLVLNDPIDRVILKEAATLLKKEVEEAQDFCQVLNDKNNIIIYITYTSTNYGKSDFSQIEKKTARFEIENLDAGYSIRRPDNEQTDAYLDSLLSKIEKLEKKRIISEGGDASKLTLNVDEISLENIEDGEKRTTFFTRLINELEGYTLDDVTDAYVYHPKKEVIEDEDGDSSTGVHISKASLKGEGVLKSEELISLYERGFYIWKIRWRVKDHSSEPNLYEFEAQFDNPLEFNGFSYISRGVKKFKAGGVYNKTSSQLSDSQETAFNRLIEKTARSIIVELNK